MGSVDVDYKHLAELVQAEERSLAAFLEESQEGPDESIMVTFQEAKASFPGYNWTHLIALINAELGSVLTPEDHVYINDRAFDAATTVFQEGAATHAFIGWRIVRSLAPMACGLASTALAQVVGGDIDVMSHLLATNTLDNLQEHMPMALGAPYIKLKRPEDNRENLQMYVSRLLKKSLEDGFYESSYLSRYFRKEAARMMRHLKPHLMYPDYKHVESQVDHLYR
ncbi:hypothetical protein MTO96_006045 [Rhipicephalus appendiculatus]